MFVSQKIKQIAYNRFLRKSGSNLITTLKKRMPKVTLLRISTKNDNNKLSTISNIHQTKYKLTVEQHEPLKEEWKIVFADKVIVLTIEFTKR